MRDHSPKVEVTISLSFEDCDYPEPTRKTIENKLRDILNKGNLTYSEKRYPDVAKINKINKEPISSNLDTFGELEEAMEEARAMADSIDKDKIFTSRQTIGRPSKEQGGSRISNSYNTDRDPLNED
tara:strand:+ start:1255 stop:1632 length:378 start_codon:yes stop_codon:yes gene_type:complete